MKIANVKRTGTRVVNKVNGDIYEIVAIEENNGQPSALSAVNVDPDTGMVRTNPAEDSKYDYITITDDNAICFRVTFYPPNPDIPKGYSVENGRLLDRDRKQVTDQGQIDIDHIICAIPGYLVLAVKAKKEEDTVTLYSYDTERDLFIRLLQQPVPYLAVAFETDTQVVIGYSSTHEEKEKDEEGNEKARIVFDSAALVLVSGKNASTLYFEHPIDVRTLIRVKGEENTFLVCSEGEVDSNGFVTECSPNYEIVRICGNSLKRAELYRQPEAVVTAASAVKIADGGYFLRGKDFMMYKDLRIDGTLAGENARDYLVDITYGDHEVKVTTADSSYSTATVIRKDTKDRGYIVQTA